MLTTPLGKIELYIDAKEIQYHAVIVILLLLLFAMTNLPSLFIVLKYTVAWALKKRSK